MGAYCSTHGHHPIGINHTSVACHYKCNGHNNSTTTTNWLGGSTFWPGAAKVETSQQEHPSYKGKSAPN
jgi:ribosomal protein L31